MKDKMSSLIMVAGVAVACSILLSGCGSSKAVSGIEDYVTEVSKITVEDDVKIIGLGEATHGNVEFQELKKDVFAAVLNNNGCKVFAIEGDFGGGMKINEYINGGEGNAKDASAELGFALYRTQEMEELIQWMRDYNDGASEENKIHFYGFDMQRYDNSKEILFSYFEKAGCSKYEEYQKGLINLSDDTVYDQKASLIKESKAAAEEIKKDLEDNKDTYLASTDDKSYEVAHECINAIIQNTELQLSTTNYGTLRDEYMKQRVDWIYKFEGEQKVFITGHDGHIDKSGAVKSYVSMGKQLADEYGDAYFAIGTDMLEGDVNVVTSAGERKNVAIDNSNDLTAQFITVENNISYLDFNKAQENSELKKILNEKQAMVNIGSTLDDFQTKAKAFYTLKMKPQEAYDSVIVVKKVTPTSPWQIEE